MRTLDWVVLVVTVALIVGAGIYQERGAKTREQYLRGGRDLRWWTIGLSVMATQASAITFLSMPGQAYEDGMGFIQFYFGLPLAMILLAIFVVPIFYSLNVYTAYEFLEKRFDRKTRQLVAFLFLLSRGLASGIAIYAPAIVLATVLGWPLQITNAVIGTVTIAYTVSGGARLVARTQTYQMVVMLFGMAVAAFIIARQLPSFGETMRLAKTLGHFQPVDFSLRFDTRYTFWSGLVGGLFVQLAYFGTDQSQVQRYLGGASAKESKLGLLFNGLFKIPMQFLILSVGVLVFVFYLFHQPPVYFDRARWQRLDTPQAHAIEARHAEAFAREKNSLDDPAALKQAAADVKSARESARALVKRNGGDGKDSDFIFIDFVVHEFPAGLVGLLLAVIFSAAMSAVAASLSSLGSTTVVDFYLPSVKPEATEAEQIRAAKWFTIWGAIAVAFAAFASQLDNLIQAVNILGSIFYGPMLGIFFVGFFLKRVGANAAFIATLIAQACVVAVFEYSSLGYLWYNVIGAVLLIAVASLIQRRHRVGPSTAR